MTHTQIYDPFNNVYLSTLLAALPMILLLGSMLIFKLKVAIAAAIGLGAALMISITVFQIPAGMAFTSAAYGAAYGLLPIGWIILNILFLFRLVEQKGLFAQLQNSLTRVTPDQRLQVLLVTLCLGSFFEGTAGFGAPVAITSVILIGLGVPGLKAAVLSLIANSTSVVFGSIGTGMIALQGVTGLGLLDISAAAGLQLLPLNLILAVWLVWTLAGFRRMLEVWPAILVIGLSFTLTQTVFAIWHGPWLATLAAAFVALVSLLILLRFWKPRVFYRPTKRSAISAGSTQDNRQNTLRAWMPWIILSLLVIAWGIPAIQNGLEAVSMQFSVPGLDGAILRTTPISTSSQPLMAIYNFNWLSSIGTAVLLSALLAGLIMGHTPGDMLRAYSETLRQAFLTLVTICTLVALGFVTRYSGLDATLGLAFAHTGVLYPFFGAVLGWLGVLSTGSVTSSNVLFGNLQQISASQLGIDPATMAAANATGGIAGKLISPQSIAITATATDQSGCEHTILRHALPHSLAMLVFMGTVILIQVYLIP
jgi:lactate permease